METSNDVSALEQLEEQQQLFAREYIKDLNGTKAAKRAKYSEQTARQQASRLLSKVNIQNAIAELKADRDERLDIDADYVIKTIVDTIERCRQGKPVYDKSGELVMMETPDGDLAPVYKYDATSVLKGAELLGRHLVMFKDNVTVTVNPLDDLLKQVSGNTIEPKDD